MKNSLWIFALLAVTFTGDRLGGFILQKISEQSHFRYNRLYSGQAESDILLVGNSRGLMFYQPYIEEKTGKNTFNISYNGMPMSLARVLVEDYLERYEPPQQMVLDVTMADRNNTPLVAGFNFYTAYSDRLEQLMLDSVPKSYWAGKVSHLYRYNGEVFQRALYYLKGSDEDWLLDRVITDDLKNSIADRQLDTITIDQNLLNDLKATVEAAQARGVDVQLVVNPYFPAYADKIANLEEFIAQVETATGMSVHNYSKAVAGVEGFGDFQHLNKAGSRVYIDRLLEDALLLEGHIGKR
ncbi:MAG: hypothetical protein AAGK47_04265 [Bacteroidota bacterium]